MGIVINECELGKNVLYTTKDCYLKVLSDNEYEFFKPPSSEVIHFRWFGYHILSEKINTTLSFDIEFLSDIPKDGTVSIKTHAPEKHYINWLDKCKKGEYVHVELPLQLHKRRQLVLWFMDTCKDYVHFKIKDIKFTPTKSIHFVTFYTEGYRLDNCPDLSKSCDMLRRGVEPYVDVFHSYTKRQLLANPETAYLVKEFPFTSEHNPTVHLVGHLRWKPYLILKTLNEINDGDIVYYRDSHVEKYPAMLNGLNETPALIERVLEDRDFFVPLENYPHLKLKKNVKRLTLETVGEFTKTYLETHLINDSIVICRKTPEVIRIVEKWLKYCEDDSLINFKVSDNEHPDFGWHTSEQGILNSLNRRLVLEGTLPDPVYSVYYRDFTLANLSRKLKVAVLLAGELRNGLNKELIKHNLYNLFELYNCDVFVSTWNKKGYSLDHGNSPAKPYMKEAVTEQCLDSICDDIRAVNIEDYDLWLDNIDKRHVHLIDKGIQQGRNLIKATAMPQFYKIWDANRLKKQYEDKNGFKYDLVIRFRPDMLLLEPIPDNYLKAFSNNKTFRTVWTLNPPDIYIRHRIYDIFFYCDSPTMDVLADAFTNFDTLLEHPFDNNLPKIDPCRLLFVQAFLNNIQVIDIPKAIGDIYRDESLSDYTRKIQRFNRQIR